MVKTVVYVWTASSLVKWISRKSSKDFMDEAMYSRGRDSFRKLMKNPTFLTEVTNDHEVTQHRRKNGDTFKYFKFVDSRNVDEESRRVQIPAMEVSHVVSDACRIDENMNIPVMVKELENESSISDNDCESMPLDLSVSKKSLMDELPVGLVRVLANEALDLSRKTTGSCDVSHRCLTTSSEVAPASQLDQATLTPMRRRDSDGKSFHRLMTSQCEQKLPDSKQPSNSGEQFLTPRCIGLLSTELQNSQRKRQRLDNYISSIQQEIERRAKATSSTEHCGSSRPPSTPRILLNSSTTPSIVDSWQRDVPHTASPQSIIVPRILPAILEYTQLGHN